MALFRTEMFLTNTNRFYFEHSGVSIDAKDEINKVSCERHQLLSGATTKNPDKNYSFLMGYLLMILAHTVSSAAPQVANSAATNQKEDLECFKEDEKKSIWDSEPIEVNNVNVQILDKISGKVFRRNIKVGEPIIFGNIQLNLKRCFKNSPEDYKETCAFIEIQENNKIIFARWLFASSPSINLFSHAVYDTRIEF